MDTAISIPIPPSVQTAAPESPECRICQEEDEFSRLEAPCHCSGTLKFAHRECIQRWCNEKGDTICEICLQPFKHGYVSSPFRSVAESVALDFSDIWEMELQDTQIIAVAAVQRHLSESDFEEYSAMNRKSAACCRSIVLILMALLLLHHATAMFAATDDGDSFMFLVIVLLRLFGFFLPCYIMIRALNVFRQHQPEPMHNVGEPTGTRMSIFLRGRQSQAMRVALVPSVDMP